MTPLRGVHILISNSKSTTTDFPVVGIGASAGGLEAFLQVFAKMPVDTGMAFVLIQHLDPTHPSLSPEIIARSTELEVEEVTNGIRIQANHIYIIPPNYMMEIQNGTLTLSARDAAPGHNMPIDCFLQSLARSEKSQSIGVVLSGTGTDGTLGLKAIKEEGGVTFAQEPSSAKFPGMPKSAIDAGAVDLILKPEDLVSELLRMKTHPYLSSDLQDFQGLDVTPEDFPANEALNKLFAILGSHKKTDFTGYKQTTVMRRIQRRMMVQKSKTLADYVKYLETHDQEVDALYDDILINVTEFFRDPESFRELAKQVFPALLKNRPKGSALRIWVPGCSSGEEVYSLAISLLEFLTKSGKQHPLQIFATDICEEAIQKARLGKYSEAAVQSLSKERRNRFFDKVENGYQIKQAIRELCLFSRHDVTSDPPFAKLDLISCRNVLIYFGRDLQKRVIPIFHYALLPEGFLWLGRAENLGDSSPLFHLVDKAHKIYSKINVPTPMIHFSSKYGQVAVMTSKTSKLPTKNEDDFVSEADQILLAKFSPPGVIVNSNLEILQFRGRTAPFLEPAAGQPSLNLIKMAQPDLLSSLRNTIQSAKHQDQSIERPGVRIDVDGQQLSLDLEVIPLGAKASVKHKAFLVLFKTAKSINPAPPLQPPTGTESRDPLLSELKTELAEIKSYQQSLVDQYEATQNELTAANEQLQSTNEELQSTNEELQSTNEEIETAKEELQSTNEELVTVNEELQMRNTDLATLSSDLNNLLVSIEIPVVIVGGDHRIRRFSPRAKSAFNLIPSDVGRPISDIRPNFDLNLDHLISEVGETLSPREIELQDFKGHWLRLRIRPYKTVHNRIDGAIVSLIDIDELKKKEQKTTDAFIQADKANLAKDVFLATLSHELRTPLSSILTWAQLIAQGKVDFEKAKQGAKVIEQNAKAQNQLIDDLLDVSRILAGKLAINLESLDPAPIIHSAIESVRSLAEKKSVEIKSDFPNSKDIIYADPIRVQQIIWNLLTNAIKFSPKNGIVHVELRYIEEQKRRYAQIRVSDQGKGIPAEFIPQIFDRFTQADGASTRVHGGLGLGLSIVKSLVDLHGGTIMAENGSEKPGAIFTLSFPVISDQSAITLSGQDSDPAPARLADRSAQGSSQGQGQGQGKEGQGQGKEGQGLPDRPPHLDGLRILIVDDDESAREAIAIYLRSLGAEVMIAGSANQALEVFKSFKPTVLLSDIGMPDEDGYSLVRKVRRLKAEEGGHIPALALSAYSTDKDIQQALAAGFHAHIGKPVEAIQLAQAILKVV